MKTDCSAINYVMTGHTGFLLNTIKNIHWDKDLKGVFAKTERGKLLKTTHAEECSVHTNSESCNI